MSIWDWALAAYARPGVPEACLTLQDQHGQNTSLLLWAVWAEIADPDRLAEAAAATRAFETAALLPIRQARRALKAALPLVADGARERLREEVKTLELEAERLLLESLAAFAHEKGGACALDALTAASRAWGPTPPPAALAELAAALG